MKIIILMIGYTFVCTSENCDTLDWAKPIQGMLLFFNSQIKNKLTIFFGKNHQSDMYAYSTTPHCSTNLQLFSDVPSTFV